MVELNYKLENDDFVAFNLHFSKSSATHKHAIRKTRLIALSATALVLFSIFYLWLKSWVVAIAVAGSGALLAWLVSPREYWKEVEKTISRMADCEGIGELGRYRLRIEEAGLREEVGGNVTTTAYSSISRIEETDEHVFIFIAPIRAYIIPKQEVGAQLVDFLEELRRCRGGGLAEMV